MNSIIIPKGPDSQREHRKLWAVVDGYVKHVTAWSCAPSTTNYWWCPEVGYSLAFGVHLFESEHEALVVAIKELEEQIKEYTKQHEQLKKSLEAFSQ